MDENSAANLDLEYEQFLEIMRPHICQLKDQRAASICAAWIERLCGCNADEKILRNKYIVTLCYQLSKGILEEPFTNGPVGNELLPINEPTLSDVSSSEVECLVLDSDGARVHMNKSSTTETIASTYCKEEINKKNVRMTDNNKFTAELSDNSPYKEIVYRNQHTEMLRHHLYVNMPQCYRYRTNNIISKLKEIKKQNTLMHHELKEMKEKSSDEGCVEEFNDGANTSTLYMRLHDSSSTLDSLKSRLKEVQSARNSLINKVQSMQEFIDNLNELKTQEIQELCAKHKLEMINMKLHIKEEITTIYEHRLQEQKQRFQAKITEIQEINIAKDELIAEKDKIIQQKESEIMRLSEQIKGSKENLHSVLKKLIDSRNEEQRDNFKIQNHILEKRIIKMEKNKIKYVKAYESKLSALQRERHLLECSLQIQIVRQRAQVVNDVAGDCQSETKKAVDKLEAKYQDIVANMQATAIQRRIEDQMAVASILQAASSIKHNVYNFLTPSIPKVPIHLRRHKNQRSDGEVESVFLGNKVFGKMNGYKNFKDENGCFEELGTLLEKVPQRDTSDKASK